MHTEDVAEQYGQEDDLILVGNGEQANDLLETEGFGAFVGEKEDKEHFEVGTLLIHLDGLNLLRIVASLGH